MKLRVWEHDRPGLRAPLVLDDDQRDHPNIARDFVAVGKAGTVTPLHRDVPHNLHGHLCVLGYVMVSCLVFDKRLGQQIARSCTRSTPFPCTRGGLATTPASC